MNVFYDEIVKMKIKNSISNYNIIGNNGQN